MQETDARMMKMTLMTILNACKAVFPLDLCEGIARVRTGLWTWRTRDNSSLRPRADREAKQSSLLDWGTFRLRSRTPPMTMMIPAALTGRPVEMQSALDTTRHPIWGWFLIVVGFLVKWTFYKWCRNSPPTWLVWNSMILTYGKVSTVP